MLIRRDFRMLSGPCVIFTPKEEKEKEEEEEEGEDKQTKESARHRKEEAFL